MTYCGMIERIEMKYLTSISYRRTLPELVSLSNKLAKDMQRASQQKAKLLMMQQVAITKAIQVTRMMVITYHVYHMTHFFVNKKFLC
jgi:hypothetical protein